jgi:hypothetical protein
VGFAAAGGIAEKFIATITVVTYPSFISSWNLRKARCDAWDSQLDPQTESSVEAWFCDRIECLLSQAAPQRPLASINGRYGPFTLLRQARIL